MSSPGARQRRRRQQYQAPHSRRELITAVGAGFAILGGTAIMIWLLRPGGLADRQPRSSWLIAMALVAALLACYLILRPSSRVRFDRRIALASSLGGVLVFAVVAGFAWPGGLLRHSPKSYTPTPAPTGSVPVTGLTTTTTGTAGTTTTTGATTPTTKP